MLLEIIGFQDDEVIARGDIYENGVKLTTLKMYFKTGVLKQPKVGSEYAVTTDWLIRMNKIGNLVWREV